MGCRWRSLCGTSENDEARPGGHEGRKELICIANVRIAHSTTTTAGAMRIFKAMLQSIALTNSDLTHVEPAAP